MQGGLHQNHPFQELVQAQLSQSTTQPNHLHQALQMFLNHIKLAPIPFHTYQNSNCTYCFISHLLVQSFLTSQLLVEELDCG